MKDLEIFRRRCEYTMDIGHLDRSDTARLGKRGSIDPHFLCDGGEYLPVRPHTHQARFYA